MPEIERGRRAPRLPLSISQLKSATPNNDLPEDMLKALTIRKWISEASITAGAHRVETNSDRILPVAYCEKRHQSSRIGARLTD
jgi:hypothetical protein